MNTKILFFFLAFIFLFQACSKDEENPEIDPNYFYAFSLENPVKEILTDLEKNRVYVLEGHAGGQMICYDYETMEILKVGIMPGYITRSEHAIGRLAGETEIYLGVDNKILIYDGNTLQRKDTIQVFSNNSSKIISSLDFDGFRTIFVGPCNDGGGVLSFDRPTKEKVTTSPIGLHCARNIASTIDPVEKTTAVISMSIQSTGSTLVHNVFDQEGNIIASDINYSVSPDYSFRTAVTNDQADYFITDSNGNIFSIIDLSFIGAIGGAFTNFFLNEQADKIYCISSSNTIQIFNYPSLDHSETIELERNAMSGFIDGDQLIVIYEHDFSTDNDIYMSKINL